MRVRRIIQELRPQRVTIQFETRGAGEGGGAAGGVSGSGVIKAAWHGAGQLKVRDRRPRSDVRDGAYLRSIGANCERITSCSRALTRSTFDVFSLPPRASAGT